MSPGDGGLGALEGVIEAAAAEDIRAGALEVLLAYLTATGRVAREEAKAYLLRLYGALRPQHESFVWSAGRRRWRSSGSGRCPASSNGRSRAA